MAADRSEESKPAGTVESLPSGPMLPALPETEFARLSGVLSSSSPAWRQVLSEHLTGRSDAGVPARVEAAEQLAAHGAPAIEPLCGALQDVSREVRLAAVRSLGEIGNNGAVLPLTRALQACFEHRSARYYLRQGRLTLVDTSAIAGTILLAVTVLHPTGEAHTSQIAGLWLLGFFLLFVSLLFHERRQRGRLPEAVAQALARIAENDPTPDLRAAVPELEAMGADILQQRGSARRAAREAAEKISRLSPGRKDLPVPGCPSDAEEAGLPRPSGLGAPGGAR